MNSEPADLFKHVRERKAAGLPKSTVRCTDFSVITASTSKFQKSTPALVHGRRAVTFHSGVDVAVWVAASVSCFPRFTLCFRKFSRGLGSMARHTWPNLWNASVCFAAQTCVCASTRLQEAAALSPHPFFFFAQMAQTCWLFVRF